MPKAGIDNRPPLTPRRREILQYIEVFIEENDIPPSVRDVQRGCGLSSPSVAHHHMNKLHHDGYIAKYFNIARGVRRG